MAIALPDSTKQVEDRIKADVQREAVDSNPYLRVHWLRSFIAGFSRRIFDFYGDLRRTELRLMPDTADSDTAPRWGNIFIGSSNAASKASGNAVLQGTLGATITSGVILTANGNEYETTSTGTISAVTINVVSITRSGTTATVVTTDDHGLSSFVPVTVAGAVQAEYNLAATAIVVTGTNSFTYQVTGSPVTPATGTITASYQIGVVPIESVGFGSTTNLDLDSPLKLQSPIVGINDTLYVDYGTIGGGTDEESTDDYKDRYLDKIRNPVAHFNTADIDAKAREVAGVTRVFVQPAGTEVGVVSAASLTRSGNVAKFTSSTPHGLEDGATTTVSGATQTDYNVINARIIVESSTIFHYVVFGTPTSPATGGISAATTIPLGQVIVYFMRDNDVSPIPSASEIAEVKTQLDTILPANTQTDDLIVLAPTAVPTNYTFTSIVPDTPTMRTAVENILDQFHKEQTSVGIDVVEDAYRAAIKNTVDPETGIQLADFTLSTPTADIAISTGEIATLGAVTFP